MNRSLTLVCLFTLACSGWGHAQPVRQEASPAPDSRPSLVTQLPDRSSTPQTAAPASKAIVPELEKMIEAATDAEVQISFIQNWTQPYALTADDILRLHDLGAEKDVLTALIRRSTELQAQARAAATVSATNRPGTVYPELATTNTQATVYPYVSRYPANTYSYLYPSYLAYPSVPYYSYRYWSPPYYSFHYGWPYRSYGYGWGGGYPWAYHYGWRHPGYLHHGPAYRGYGGQPGFHGRGRR
jgi:hypothetical protein